MKNKTKSSVIFLLTFCLFTISSADIGIGISVVGTISSITDIEDENTTPVGYYMNQNYPNLFNPVTTIFFGLERSSFINLKVYNSLGQKVAALINNKMNPGSYKVKFNASNLSNGIYYYKIQAGEFHSVKMLLLQ
ncbi:T9SS type A sorting domain-containing protein [candidate division KSB1 bacterium]|nr:T9SS type A sorting domain-containing protein [candidate division KSB1 bacterium]